MSVTENPYRTAVGPRYGLRYDIDDCVQRQQLEGETMARITMRLALGLALVFTLSGAAAAAKNICLQGAKSDLKACNAGCKTDYKDEVAICRGHDPVCAQTCRDGRQECRQPLIQANLKDCLDSCEPLLDAARATCKTQVGCGGKGNPCGFDPNYISCINPAQSAAFACRDTCNDAFRLNVAAQAAIQACEDSFKTCVQACPPPPPPAS